MGIREEGLPLKCCGRWHLSSLVCWMDLNSDFYVSIKCFPYYVPIWLLLLSPIKTVSIYTTYFTRSLDCCLSPECYLLWEYPGALHILCILNPLVFYSRAQTCGQNASPLYSTKQLSALIQSQAPPAQKKESSEACSCESLHSFLPRLNTPAGSPPKSRG